MTVEKLEMKAEKLEMKAEKLEMKIRKLEITLREPFFSPRRSAVERFSFECGWARAFNTEAQRRRDTA
jgi:hypothetical protein